MKPITFLLALLVLCSCSKTIDEDNPVATAGAAVSHTTSGNTIQYLIRQHGHVSDQSTLFPVNITELKFAARFDSSAIYQTIVPLNQLDINKLYGFSDNGAFHHEFSARFGWRWSDGALRLFAYVYNDKKVASRELTTVPIGKDIACAIRVKGDVYEFVVEDKVVTMPRSSTTTTAKGYLLYPYFGGDEVAPHDIRIWIRPL